MLLKKASSSVTVNTMWLPLYLSNPMGKRLKRNVMTTRRMYAAAATTYIPAPIASPSASVVQIPAAVVSPLIELPFLKMTPAQRKLMPLIDCAAIREASAPLTPAKNPPSAVLRSANPYLDMIMISAAAQQTIMCVNDPTPRNDELRSTPIRRPTAHAMTRRRANSRYCEFVKMLCSIVPNDIF